MATEADEGSASTADATTTDSAESEEKPFSFELEKLENCKRSLSVTIEADHVHEQLLEQFRELNDTVVLDGFRRGKIPRALIEKRFGDDVRQELRGKLVTDTFEQIIGDEKLEVLGEPEPEFDDEPADMPRRGEPFGYRVAFEVKPAIELGDYKGLELKRPSAEVTDEMLEQAIAHNLGHHSELKSVEGKNAKAAIDDVVTGSLTITAGETEVLTDKTAKVWVAEGHIRGIPIPKEQGDLAGVKAGETKTFEVTLPDTHPKHPGEAATVTITVEAIERQDKPELTDEFAKEHFGTESVADYKERVRGALGERRAAWAEDETRKRAVEALIETHDFELPQGFLEEQLDAWENNKRLELMQRNAPMEQVDKELEHSKETNRSEMEKSLRGWFLLDAVGKKERIFVTEDQLDQEIAGMASHYGMPLDEMRGFLEGRGMLAQLRANLRETAIKQLLVTKAKVKDEAPGESQPEDEIHDHSH